MSEGSVEAGRLYLDVEGDTTGLGRSTQRKVDVEMRKVRARIKAEIDARGLVGSAKSAAKTASEAAKVRIKAEIDARSLAVQARAAAKTVQDSVKVRLRAELDSRGLVGQAKAAALAASQASTVKVKADVDASRVVAQTAAATKAAEASAKVEVPVKAKTDTVAPEVEAARKAAEAKAIQLRVDVKMRKDALNALSSLSIAPLIAGGVMQLANSLTTLVGGLFAVSAAGSQAVGVLAILPNLAGIAVQGLGAALIGFQGVGEAVKELSTAQKAATQTAGTQAKAEDAVGQAAKASGETIRASRRQIADAEQALADARAAAAERVIAAQESLSDAQWADGRASLALTQARKNLSDANVEAKERIEDLNLALKGSVLDERAAALAVQRAQARLEDAKYDPTTSALSAAEQQNAYDQAVQSLAEVRERNGDLRAETAKANKDGVKGSAAVKDAQDGVVVAAHDRQEAAEALAASEANIAKTATANTRAVTDAQRALADAQRQGKAATQQAAQSLAQATQAAIAGTPAMLKLQSTLEGMSPAAVAFSRYLVDTVIPRLRLFRNAVQEALLPPLTAGINAALPLLDTLQAGMVDTADVLGRGAVTLGNYFARARTQADVSHIMASNNRAMGSFGVAILATIDFFKSLAVSSDDLTERFAKWTAGLAQNTAELIDSDAERQNLREWLDRAGDRAAQLGDIFADLGKSIFNLGRGAGSTGDSLLDSLEKTAQGWRDYTGSAEGQERIQATFEAMRPAFIEISRLVANLGSLFVEMNEAGGGSLVGLLKTVNLLVVGLTKLFEIPFVGSGLSWLLTIGGAAAGIGLVAAKIGKMGQNVKTLGKFLGGGKGKGGLFSRFIGGVTGAKDAIDDELPADKKKSEALEGVGAAGESGGKSLRTRFTTAVKGTVSALKTGAKSAVSFAASIGKGVYGAAKRGALAVGSLAAATGRAAGAALAATGRFIAQTAAMAAQRAILVAQRAATIAMAIAQGALNAVMALNPFVAIAIAAIAFIALLVLLYKKNATFRAGVQAVWAGVKAAISGAWNNVIKPVFRALSAGVSAVGAAFSWLWSNAIRPALSAIGAGARIYFAAVRAVFAVLRASVRLVGAGFTWLWRNAVAPALSGIRTVITNVYRGGILPILTALRVFLRDKVGATFTWLRNKIVTPVMNGISATISAVWSRGISPVFTAIKDGVGAVAGAFETARDGIGKAWGALKALVKAPIKFVLFDVLDNGLIKGYNKVADFFKMPLIDTVTPKGFHTGGTVGGHSPHSRSDNIPAMLTADEEVIKQRSARRMRRDFPGALEHINATGRMPEGHADGGTVGSKKKAPGAGGGTFKNPDGIVGSGRQKITRITAAQLSLARTMGLAVRVMQGSFQPSTSYSGSSHAGAGVVDTGPGNFNAQKILRQVGFAAWGRNFRGAHSAGSGAHVHSVSLIDPGAKGNSQARAFRNGGDGLGGRDYGPRPKVLPDLLTRLNAGNLSLGGFTGGGGAGDGKPSWWSRAGAAIKNAFGNPADFIQNKVKTAISGLGTKFGDSPFIDMIKSIPGGLVKAGKGKVAEIFKGKDDGGGDGGKGLGNLLSGITATGNKAIAKQVAGNRGWGSGTQWHALNSLIMKESGYNNRAQNPNSTAYGIGQFLDGTWATVGGKKTSDPKKQIAYMLKYIDQRYGTPTKALAFHLRNNSYDNGGVLQPGLTLTNNESGKPEAILNNAQWGDFRTAVAALTADDKGKGQAQFGSIFGPIDLSGRRAEELPDLLDELEFAGRVISRGGVYANPTA